MLKTDTKILVPWLLTVDGNAAESATWLLAVMDPIQYTQPNDSLHKMCTELLYGEKIVRPTAFQG